MTGRHVKAPCRLLHRWRQHPVYVIWQMCEKCGVERKTPGLPPRQGQAFAVFAERMIVRPAGSRPSPPPMPRGARA